MSGSAITSSKTVVLAAGFDKNAKLIRMNAMPAFFEDLIELEPLPFFSINLKEGISTFPRLFRLHHQDEVAI